jgi:toxin ParE1/3/4
VRIEWTPLARRHREDIWLHIAADNVRAACELDEKFSLAVERLGQFPESGRPGLVPQTREAFPQESYRLVYRVADGVILILALVHVARQWPPISEEDL